jgi:large subunit ribosomal protein L5
MTDYIDFYTNTIKEDMYTRRNVSLEIKKIGMNVGFQNATSNKRDLLMPITGLELISGQYPQPSYSKIAIANFNLKKNLAIGCTEKVHGKEIFFFMEKLKILTLPAIKELQNLLKKNFDGHGNYSIGLKDITFLPDISRQYEKLQILVGMDLVFNASSYRDDKLKFLLNTFQIPINALQMDNK